MEEYVTDDPPSNLYEWLVVVLVACVTIIIFVGFVCLAMALRLWVLGV